MTTSAARRSPSLVRRAGASLVASALTVGLSAGPVDAVPAAPAPLTDGAGPARIDTTTEPLERTFVQEGSAGPDGGQLVAWGNRTSAPATLPNGVHAVGMAVSDQQLLVLRSDGGVDRHELSSSRRSQHAPAPTAEVSYTAVATTYNGSARLLRSDGTVADMSGDIVLTPPDGSSYTAIAEGLALRSDGTLDPSGHPGIVCTDARDPGENLQYTAISRGSGSESWAALRSDGALVVCHAGRDSSTTTVYEPPAGTRFIGVDMQDQAIGATADGRVISPTSGEELTAAPDGRSVVTLATMGGGRGAATLDDGTLLTWGLSAPGATPPTVPQDRAVYTAVAGDDDTSRRWAIMHGDPVAVDVVLDRGAAPADRPRRVTDWIRMAVSASLPDGTPVSGEVTTTVRGPDGSTTSLEASPVENGEAEVDFDSRDHEDAGRYELDLTFTGSPYAATILTTALDLEAPSPVTVSTTGPSTWHQGTEDTLCVTLATEDGSRLWYPNYDQAALRSTDGTPSELYTSYDGARASGCAEHMALPVGSHTVHLDYGSWGDVDAASWSGEVEVLPAATTQIDTDLPGSWTYGHQPEVVWATVTAEDTTPVGTTGLRLEDWYFGSDTRLDAEGRARLWLGNEDELEPGTHTLTAVYKGGHGFLPSQQDHTVIVEPAAFTAAEASITGAPVVGQALTAETGTWTPAATGFDYVWRVDGEPVHGATSRTFTLPPSALNKRVTVTVTGSGEHHESTVTSDPTGSVAHGAVTAPRPTIDGALKVGSTLTVDRGTWDPEPTWHKYIWKADGVRIATTRSNTFTIPASAHGKRLVVKVKGSRPGYEKKTTASYWTKRVRAS
ncbi:Ig-like domain repeat protein [Isoptericola haloaureus]|uniref:Ig-like domain repeat protein n=1 Tax=Isoptericola haloaureus TaxID=1542902 RepID=A0ABU7Z3I1_9MICO